MRYLIPFVLGALCALALIRTDLIQFEGAAPPAIPVAPIAPQPLDEANHARPVRAEVVEVRDGSLFGGACHLASEAGSQGREALIAITLEDGVFEGIGLSGVRALVAVSADGNLDTDAPRQSEIWVDGSSVQSKAVAQWLERERPAAVGHILALHRSEVEIDRRGPAFKLRVPGVALVRGESITDGSCCSMPERRLYDPLVTQAADTVVGFATTCRFEGTEHLARWTYSDANNVHVGRVGSKECTLSSCEFKSPCELRATCEPSLPKL